MGSPPASSETYRFPKGPCAGVLMVMGVDQPLAEYLLASKVFPSEPGQIAHVVPAPSCAMLMFAVADAAPTLVALVQPLGSTPPVFRVYALTTVGALFVSNGSLAVGVSWPGKGVKTR